MIVGGNRPRRPIDGKRKKRLAGINTAATSMAKGENYWRG